MKRGSLVSFAIAAGIALLIAANTLFVVNQTQQAIVLEFGALKSVILRPGLYVKAPFIDSVTRFDNWNLGTPLDAQQIVASDQERLVVDAFVRWRITDPALFYRAAQSQETGESRLEGMAQSALRRVLGRVDSTAIIRTGRGPLMAAIRDNLNREAGPQMGVQIVDVRIRQAELPAQTQERLFERMRSERQQEAARLRAEGNEEALRIRADADRQVTITLATARGDASRIRGEGEGQRAQIYARAFGRDPEFAAFYRSLQAYEAALPAGTPMVMPPDGDFFRYLRSQTGQARR